MALEEAGEEGRPPRIPGGGLGDVGASGTGREGFCSLVGLTVPPVPPTLRWGALTPHTCLICLKPSAGTLEKMLHSGWLRIWKATAQWWFSRGEMSL